LSPYLDDTRREFVVARASAEQCAQIGAVSGEQTGIEHPTGGEPSSRAMAAERLRHAGDESDFGGGTGDTMAPCDLATITCFDRGELEGLPERSQHLVGADDVALRPTVGLSDVHELDETHAVAPAREVTGDVHELVLVQPSFDHRVDLDVLKAAPFRRLDTA